MRYIEPPLPWPHTERESMICKKAFQMARESGAEGFGAGFRLGFSLAVVIMAIMSFIYWMGS